MAMANLIMSTIAALAGVAAALICWWMPIYLRVRERFAEGEPQLDFDLRGAQSIGQRVSLQCTRNPALGVRVSVDGIFVHENIGDLKPDQGRFDVGLDHQPLANATYRCASVHYRDRWGREFRADKDIETTPRPDGTSVFVNTTGGIRVVPPPMRYRDAWGHRHAL